LTTNPNDPEYDEKIQSEFIQAVNNFSGFDIFKRLVCATRIE